MQRRLLASQRVSMSAASYLELFIVVHRKFGALTSRDVQEYLKEMRIEVVPFDQTGADLAREAFERFGKGRHPAGLNFGDCFSYALAKQRGEPLLCKGADFPQTDLLIA